MSSSIRAASVVVAVPSRGRTVVGLAVALLAVAATLLLSTGDPVAAGIVPTVPMGTAANYLSLIHI